MTTHPPGASSRCTSRAAAGLSNQCQQVAAQTKVKAGRGKPGRLRPGDEVAYADAGRCVQSTRRVDHFGGDVDSGYAPAAQGQSACQCSRSSPKVERVLPRRFADDTPGRQPVVEFLRKARPE